MPLALMMPRNAPALASVAEQVTSLSTVGTRLQSCLEIHQLIRPTDTRLGCISATERIHFAPTMGNPAPRLRQLHQSGLRRPPTATVLREHDLPEIPVMKRRQSSHSCLLCYVINSPWHLISRQQNNLRLALHFLAEFPLCSCPFTS